MSETVPDRTILYHDTDWHKSQSDFLYLARETPCLK